MVWETGGRKVGGRGVLPLNNRSITYVEVFDKYELREELWKVSICLEVCIKCE